MNKQKKGSLTLIALFIVVFLFLGAFAFLTSGLHPNNSISGAAIWDQTISGGIPLWFLFLFLLILVFVLASFAVWKFAYRPNKLRKKLKKLNLLLAQGSSQKLKQGYLEVYNLYLKLSDKHKQNFYTKITKIRESIEENLKAENNIVKLLEKSGRGGLDEQKTNYREIRRNYQKLSPKIKEKYYQDIVRLRERMERGT